MKNLRACNFIKGRLQQHRCFPVKFAKFLRTFSANDCLSLYVYLSENTCEFFEPLAYFEPLVSFCSLSRNLWFCDVFRGYRKRPMTWNGLNDYLKQKLSYRKLGDQTFWKTTLSNKSVQFVISMGLFLISLLVTLNKYLSVMPHLILLSFLDFIIWVWILPSIFVLANWLLFHPFHATGLFLYTMKTLETQRFSGVLMECKKRSAPGVVLRRATFANSDILF